MDFYTIATSVMIAGLFVTVLGISKILKNQQLLMQSQNSVMFALHLILHGEFHAPKRPHESEAGSNNTLH